MANGKGSLRRPATVSERELADRWAAAFGQAGPRPVTELERAAEAAQREAARRGEPVLFKWQPPPANGPRPLLRPAEIIEVAPPTPEP